MELLQESTHRQAGISTPPKRVYDGAGAALNAVQAQVEQSRAAREQSRATLDQTRATLTHMRDVLRKTTYTAPINGIVSYIDVRVGENVVPGIQNAQGPGFPGDYFQT